jgi:hypothetical protein
MGSIWEAVFEQPPAQSASVATSAGSQSPAFLPLERHRPFSEVCMFNRRFYRAVTALSTMPQAAGKQNIIESCPILRIDSRRSVCKIPRTF